MQGKVETTKKGVSTMTRKQAISKAIAALHQTGENTEAIRVLEELREELPIIHWSDAALRDTVDQFIADTGRMPTATDFRCLRIGFLCVTMV